MRKSVRPPAGPCPRCGRDRIWWVKGTGVGVCPRPRCETCKPFHPWRLPTGCGPEFRFARNRSHGADESPGWDDTVRAIEDATAAVD